MIKIILLYVMAILYVAAGGKPLYQSPPVRKDYSAVSARSRSAQLRSRGGGSNLRHCAVLFPATRPGAAWGIIALLVAVFPANLYMYQQNASGLPSWMLLVRLPLQLVLIAWAWWYTGNE